eukprot:XP_019922795.1 PREDICTED: uncharacterized protein LOC105328235 [Crassostrea gigas]
MALKFCFLFFSAAILVLVSLPTLECFDLFWYFRWFPGVPLANKTSDIVNISSSVKIPNELPTEYLQDKLLLSNQTTAKTAVREENTTKGDELHLPNEEDDSWRANKVLVYCIIGLSCLAVVMVCLHIVLCLVIKLCPLKP